MAQTARDLFFNSSSGLGSQQGMYGSKPAPSAQLVAPRTQAAAGVQTYKAPTSAPTTTNNPATGNQSAWQAAGHAGIAPVGYNGESGAGDGGGTVDPYAQVRNDISSAWDNYLNTLQGTSGYFDEQRTAQEGVADSQLQQGITTANESKANSLRDIANTTRNAFQAGNNYLGAMGAGDSSAANQYSFAINQQASKQTGDLNNFVQSKIQELQSTHSQQVQQIAAWFSQQQQTLKQQIAQGQLSKGQDIANLSKSILDQAMQATNTAKQNSQAQYNALLTWAGITLLT